MAGAREHVRILEAVDRVRTWTRGNERAVHKPLLLLLALGRVQRGEPRLVPFRDVEDDLRRLLREFGPTRQSIHPEYPFWRLQADKLWEVPEHDALRRRQSNSDPPLTEMRKASGGFPVKIEAAFRADASLIRVVADAVLDAHFPPSLQQNLLAAVGLEFDARPSSGRRPRDAHFRSLILGAYGFQCAVCGLDTRVDGMSIGAEAAHVHWHCYGGPDTLDNGVALCALHHAVLDLGLLTLSERHTILVSSRLDGGDAVERNIGAHHGQPLRGPKEGHSPVALESIAWHRRDVFKGPARP